MLSALLFCAMNPSTGLDTSLEMYVGTYTSEKGSKGIYHVTLDTTTGQLSEPKLAVEAKNPSYVAFHPNGKLLYAIDEGSAGTVLGYDIKPDGTLSAINSATAPTNGGGPCHVAVDPKGRSVMIASYGGGSVTAFKLDDKGKIGDVLSSAVFTGSGPNKSRQEAPHLHGVYPDKKGKYAYACDLGTDTVKLFEIEKTGGLKFRLVDLRVDDGGGPRHLAFHPNGRMVFVNSELTNEVTAFAVDTRTGGLAKVNQASTLPEDADPKGNSTAEIVCHPNGKWLYVSNRGHNSIAHFEVATDGTLVQRGVYPSVVKIPRGFDLDQSGKWLVAAGQDSGDLVAFSVSPRTGALKQMGVPVKVSKPVCVVFRK